MTVMKEIYTKLDSSHNYCDEYSSKVDLEGNIEPL